MAVRSSGTVTFLLTDVVGVAAGARRGLTFRDRGQQRRCVHHPRRLVRRCVRTGFRHGAIGNRTTGQPGGNDVAGPGVKGPPGTASGRSRERGGADFEPTVNTAHSPWSRAARSWDRSMSGCGSAITARTSSLQSNGLLTTTDNVDGFQAKSENERDTPTPSDKEFSNTHNTARGRALSARASVDSPPRSPTDATSPENSTSSTSTPVHELKQGTDKPTRQTSGDHPLDFYVGTANSTASRPTPRFGPPIRSTRPGSPRTRPVVSSR